MSIKDLKDEELLQRSRAGDQAACSELYERYYHKLKNFIRYSFNSEMAEDVAQETLFSILFQQTSKIPIRASLRAYIFQAAKFISFKRLRRTEREKPIDDISNEPYVEAEQEPLRVLLSKESTSAVQGALKSLTEAQRAVLILIDFEDYSLAEAAAVIGVDVGVIKSRLHRAREQMKKALSVKL